MKVLQLGEKNWQELYTIDKDLEWKFNKVKTKDKNGKYQNDFFDVILITEKNELMSNKFWQNLRNCVLPYHILYEASIVNQLDQAGKYFLKSIGAQKITEEPQVLINKLKGRFFSGQSGMRVFPTELKLNTQLIEEFEYLDSAHLKLNLDTHGKWINLGSYKAQIFIDPEKLIYFWLTVTKNNFRVRMRIFMQRGGTDGDMKDQHVIEITSENEDYFSQLEMSKNYRLVAINLEVKGTGDLIIGPLHSRWGRDGSGTFMAGGKKIVNPTTLDDIAYLFNPGDLKPPLNVYFSGARELEGFEAFYLFNRLKKPSLLFTDMRLAIGAFYDDEDKFMEKEIIKTIKQKLQELGFDNSQLIMNGISMGTYPAIKYGAKLEPYAINVAKPITNLGYVANRTLLDRPDDFNTIFDIDNSLVDELTQKNLKELDEKFWQEFDKADLSKTRLFLGYMENDDYDDQAIAKLKQSPAVKNSLQFTVKGFAGRHNDDPRVNSWFMARLSELIKEFEEKKQKDETN